MKSGFFLTALANLYLFSHFSAPFCVLNVLLLLKVIAVKVPSLFFTTPVLICSLLPRFKVFMSLTPVWLVSLYDLIITHHRSIEIPITTKKPTKRGPVLYRLAITQRVQIPLALSA